MPHIWIRVRNTGATGTSSAVGDRTATQGRTPVQRIDDALSKVPGGRRERTFESTRFVYALARVSRRSRDQVEQELNQPGDEVSEETNEKV